MISEMFDSIRTLFSAPPAEVMAVRQLNDAKRLLLEAHAYREEAEAMVAKYEDRIQRLTLYVRNTTDVGKVVRAKSSLISPRGSLGEEI